VKPIGKDLNSVKRFTQNAYILFYKKNYIDSSQIEASRFNNKAGGDISSSTISRSRSPSFYRQLQQAHDHVDYFEKHTPSNSKLVNQQKTYVEQ